MRQLNVWFVCLSLVAMSCTIPEPLGGQCANDLELGNVDCQCVTPDENYSKGSKGYVDPTQDYLMPCSDESSKLYLELGESEIYACHDYRCVAYRCPEGEVRRNKRECMSKPDCGDHGVYTAALGCTCDPDYVWIGGACEKKKTCREDQVYRDSDNTCACPPDYEDRDDKCVHTKSCTGANQVYDPDKGVCVCDKDALQFGEACITSQECTDSTRRIKNNDGTCTCVSGYTHFMGDCYQAGDSLTFGSYPQDENSDTPSPITWLILEIKEDSALLISKYVLEQYQYHPGGTDITWERSNVRSYLNGLGAAHNDSGMNHDANGFIDKAFTAEERRWIKEVTNKNPNAPEKWNSTPGGNDTQDKVFLLSHDEVLQYFPTNKARLAHPTAYAIHPPEDSGRNKLWTCQVTCSGDDSCSTSGCNNDGTNVQACSNVQCGSYWWLRSPGDYPTGAASVHVVGGVYDIYVDDVSLGLRPALYVHLNL